MYFSACSLIATANFIIQRHGCTYDIVHPFFVKLNIHDTEVIFMETNLT